MQLRLAWIFLIFRPDIERMNRRLLVFFVLVNAFVSLTIAVTVVWVAEQRRPSSEDLAVQTTPPVVVLIATPAPVDAQAAQQTAASQTPAAVAGPPETGEREAYVVEAGDTLLAIAGRFGLTLDRLMDANELTDPDYVYVGQHLAIPASQSSAGAPADSAVGLPQRGLQLRMEDAGALAAEAVQVLNDSDAAVNLQGWTLSRDGGPIYTFGSALLFPGSGIHLYTGSGEDNSLKRYWGRTESPWLAGSTIVLRNPAGELIAQIDIE